MNDYLKQVEDQLVELTERGAHRRPRPRLDVLAVTAAVAAVAAVAIVVATIGGTAHHGATASHRSTVRPVPHNTAPHTGTAVVAPGIPSGTPPAGTQVPPGFAPESFTAIGELDWWLLGTATCSGSPCTSIVRTTDGGRTFVAIPAPKAPGQPSASVSQVRFANATDGFAYGPGLWTTHDGGAHWQWWSLPGRVDDLATSGAYAYAILSNPSTGAGQLLRASVDGDSWQPLPAAGNATRGLWVQGSEVLLESSDRSGQQLRVSHDDGRTFTTYPVPPSVVCQFEEPEPPAVWAHCSTGMMSGTWRSAAGGANFAAVGGRGLPELPNSAAFGSASATTAVAGYQELYRTTDGGATWTPVSGPTGISWWQYVGFTDPTHGVAIGYLGAEQPSNERLYYTTDGGASYHLVSIG
jgi:hypothetical protein